MSVILCCQVLVLKLVGFLLTLAIASELFHLLYSQLSVAKKYKMYRAIQPQSANYILVFVHLSSLLHVYRAHFRIYLTYFRYCKMSCYWGTFLCLTCSFCCLSCIMQKLKEYNLKQNLVLFEYLMGQTLLFQKSDIEC